MQVQQFNAGTPIDTAESHSGEQRLMEIEKTISLVTSALSSQQKTIETITGKDVGYSHQLSNLKQKLIELQREYDMVISENYSLRARVKKLSQNNPDDQYASFQVVPGNAAKKANNKALYEDTRIMQASDLHSTDDYEISDSG